MIALVDCNNFFVSVERVFDPSLRHKPVAVLSSNDGCIIARSNDIKPLIPMGVPVFKVRSILQQHGVVLKSSNFALYSDMSRRVMAVLKRFSPSVDVYSIDEAFLEFPRSMDPRELRMAVMRDVGIPVSIGVAATRTLAKAAATLAKHREGVLDFTGMGEAEINAHLSVLAIQDVWGIGRRLGDQFRFYRIRTAYDLKKISASLLDSCNTTVQKMVGELRGQPTPHEPVTHSKSMVSTRSFGKVVSNKSEIAESLSSHAAHIGIKLRREGLKTGLLGVFISTGKKGAIFSSRYQLPVATDDTRTLISIVHRLLPHVYTSRLHYKKSGVMAYQLTPVQQLALESEELELKHAEDINTVVDTVNKKWGTHSLHFAAEGVYQYWASKHELRSPRYTTEWSELRHVK